MVILTLSRDAVCIFYRPILKLVDQLTYLSNNISSTKSDLNIYIGKGWTEIDRLSILWKADKVKQYHCMVTSIEEKTKWKLHKAAACCSKKKILEAASPQNGSYMATNLPISQAIQIKQARHTGHCCRSKDKLISDILWRSSRYGHTSADQQKLHQLCTDTGCHVEDLPIETNGKRKSKESVLSTQLDDIYLYTYITLIWLDTDYKYSNSLHFSLNQIRLYVTFLD